MKAGGGTEPGGGRLATLALLLALVVPPLLLHAGHLGPGRVPFLRDLSRTHLPLKELAASALRDGRLPLWDATHGGGAPLLANANFFHLHPVSLLFLVLPYPLAFSLGLAGLSVLGALGAGLWIRQRGGSRVAAATAGIAFALGGLGASGTNLYNVLASHVSVPWALGAAEALAARPSARRTGLLAIALAATLAGGEPLAWAFAVLLAALLPAPPLRRRVIPIAAAAALSLLVCGLQLAPLAEVTRQSRRGQGFALEESMAYALAPSRIAELVRPGTAAAAVAPAADPRVPPFAHLGSRLLLSLYAGISVIALALLGLLLPGRDHDGGRDGRGRLALVALGAVVLALGPSTPVLPALWRLLPPLHGLRYPEKLLLPLFLVVAALAARGVDALRARAPRLGSALALAPVVVAADLLAAHRPLVPGAPSALFLAPPPLVRDLEGLRTYFWIERGGWVPPGRDLADFHAAYVRAAVPPAGEPFGVRYVFDVDPDALDPLRMLALARLVHASPSARARLLPMAAVERVVSPARLDDVPGLRELPASSPTATSASAVHVYALEPAPYARVVAAARARRAGGAADAARTIAGEDFDPRREAVVEGDVPPGEPPPALVGQATVRVERPRPEEIHIRAEGPGLLVVAETWAPGWGARVDGREAPILHANLAFMGITLAGPGAHDVRITYRPASVRLGLGLSVAGIVAIVLLLARKTREE